MHTHYKFFKQEPGPEKKYALRREGIFKKCGKFSYFCGYLHGNINSIKQEKYLEDKTTESDKKKRIMGT